MGFFAEAARTSDRGVDQNYLTGRAQLLFHSTDAIDLRIIGDYTRRRENCCIAVQTIAGPTGAILDLLSPDTGVARPADPFARIGYSNRGTAQRLALGVPNPNTE